MSKSNGSGKEIFPPIPTPKTIDPLDNPEFNREIDKAVDDLMTRPLPPGKIRRFIRAIIGAITKTFARFSKLFRKRGK